MLFVNQATGEITDRPAPGFVPLDRVADPLNRALLRRVWQAERRMADLEQKWETLAHA